MTSTIIVIGSVAAALTAVIVLIGKIINFAKTITGYFDKIQEDITALQRHGNENYLSTLRLTIMSEEMPITERISAGDKYVLLGGNGAVKHKYNELIEEYGKGA